MAKKKDPTIDSQELEKQPTENNNNNNNEEEEKKKKKKKKKNIKDLQPQKTTDPSGSITADHPSPHQEPRKKIKSLKRPADHLSSTVIGIDNDQDHPTHQTSSKPSEKRLTKRSKNDNPKHSSTITHHDDQSKETNKRRPTYDHDEHEQQQQQQQQEQEQGVQQPKRKKNKLRASDDDQEPTSSTSTPSKKKTHHNHPPPPQVSPASSLVPIQAPSIDPGQLDRAIETLIEYTDRHHHHDQKKKNPKDEVPAQNLFDQQVGSNDCFVNLVVGLKRIVSRPKHKPIKLHLPHPLYDPRISPVCLIVKDPQREYKDLLEELNIHFISKVVGIDKLKGKHSSYEARRLLLSSHALFLVDVRVMPLLPRILGVKFFKFNKLPIPVDLSERSRVKGELERAISNGSLRIGGGSCLSIKVADLSLLNSSEVRENLRAVLDQIPKRIPLGGWRNVQSLHLKTGTSIALPLWLAPLDPNDHLSRFDLNPTQDELLKIQAAEARRAERKERKRIKISNKLQLKKLATTTTS